MIAISRRKSVTVDVPAIPMTKAGEIGWPSSPYLDESIQIFAIFGNNGMKIPGGPPMGF